MFEGILLALAAALVYGFLGIAFEVAAKRHYKLWDFILYKQCSGFLIGLACTAWLGLPPFRAELMWLGLIGAISYLLTCAAYLTASRDRNIAANWTILNLSVALPLLVSVLWFHDKFNLTKGLGVMLTLLSILLIGGGFGEMRASWRDSRWLRSILAAFLLNGVLAMLFRFVPDGYGALFTVYFYGISVVLVLPYKLIRDRAMPREPGLLPMSLLGAVTHWSGMMLTMAALLVVGKASREAGVIVYPITNGLVIPVGVLLGVLILRQQIDRRTRWGVVAGMAALTLMFLP
jgi:drug/metabolite transporter (DMT)-like permease